MHTAPSVGANNATWPSDLCPLKVRFAPDSLVEGNGFELPVRGSGEAGLSPLFLAPIAWDGSVCCGSASFVLLYSDRQVGALQEQRNDPLSLTNIENTSLEGGELPAGSCDIPVHGDDPREADPLTGDGKIPTSLSRLREIIG